MFVSLLLLFFFFSSMVLIDFWNKWALFHTRNWYVSVDPTETVFDFSVEMRCHWWQSITMANNRIGSMFYYYFYFFVSFSLYLSLDFISYKNQFVYAISEWSLKHICRWTMMNEKSKYDFLTKWRKRIEYNVPC